MDNRRVYQQLVRKYSKDQQATDSDESDGDFNSWFRQDADGIMTLNEEQDVNAGQQQLPINDPASLSALSQLEEEKSPRAEEANPD